LVAVKQRWQTQPVWSTNDQGEDFIDFGNGIEVPAVLERTVSQRDLPYSVVLTMEFQDDRYEVAALKFIQRTSGDPVLGARLREVPIDTLIRQVMSEFLPRRKPRRKPGERRIIRQADVVFIYQLAYALHLPPTKTVADHLDISQKSAEQAVIAARAAGRLPATEQGRAKG
jgi:hypothetical protein